jgi:hypothetical protein
VNVPLLEAEAVVGDLRARLDRSAGWGVPAHVTLLYPFLARTGSTTRRGRRWLRRWPARRRSR